MSTNVNQKLSIVQKIEQAAPAQLANIPEVADRFMHIYSVMNGGDHKRAGIKYEAEKFHFMKLIQDKPDLQQCTKLSLYGCFLDMAVNGLSFDPSMKHAYVVSFNVNVGSKENKKWEKRATLMISGYGELQMRMRQGQIKYADNPVLVYEGDKFSYGTRNGHPYVDHEAVIPRKSDNIIACYIRLERNDGSVDYKVMSIEEIMKLKAFSKDQNSLAWTSGLPGMVQAKTIKHAFRSYPKIRMGEFTTLQSQVIDEESEVIPKIDYGLNGSMPAPASELPEATGTFQATVVAEHAEPVKHNAPVSDDAFLKEVSPTEGKRFDSDEF